MAPSLRLQPAATQSASAPKRKIALDWGYVLVLSRLYLVLALAVGAALTISFFSWLAIALLVLELYCIYRPPRPGLDLSLVLTVLLLIPLVYASIIGSLGAPFMLIPGLPLLDNALKKQPRGRVQRFALGIRLTSMTKNILLALGGMLLVSIIAFNPALAIASAVVACYFAVVMAYFLVKAGKNPLEASELDIRTIAGERAEAHAAIRSRIPMRLGITFGTPYTWATIDPELVVIENEADVKVSVKPLLCGPAQVPLRASVSDPWGLLEIGQEIGPVDLHVVPRAKYAEWLAKKFLDQTAPESSAPSIIVPPITAVKRGGGKVEYYGSRSYRPGDRLKDINWKQSLKIHDLVVNDYSEPQWQQGILLVNLTATDAEEADVVISSLISSVLTMAKQSMNTVLAAYNQEKLLALTRPLNPRDAVRKALALAEEVVMLPPFRRFLQPQDMGRLKRTISQLEGVKAGPSEKLSGLLSLEYKAMQETARDHPLSAFIMDAQRHLPPPATVTVVSPWNHDVEALSVTAERLRQSGYNVVCVSASEPSTLAEAERTEESEVQ